MKFVNWFRTPETKIKLITCNITSTMAIVSRIKTKIHFMHFTARYQRLLYVNYYYMCCSESECGVRALGATEGRTFRMNFAQHLKKVNLVHKFNRFFRWFFRVITCFALRDLPFRISGSMVIWVVWEGANNDLYSGPVALVSKIRGWARALVANGTIS